MKWTVMSAEELSQYPPSPTFLRQRPEREAWLQVGDRYVIVEVPNRLRGVTINSKGEAV